LLQYNLHISKRYAKLKPWVEENLQQKVIRPINLIGQKGLEGWL